MKEHAPKILAISGAHESLLVAVQNGGQCFYYHRKGFLHNEYLIGLCEQLLAKSGLKLQNLQVIAIDLGPGSFTGQRISLSFAKGLSFAMGVPLVGFNSFALWRHYVERPGVGCDPCEWPLLVLIDGRKRRFYARLFDSAGAAISTWDLSSHDLCRKLYPKMEWRGEYGQSVGSLVTPLNVSGPGAPLFWEELDGQALGLQFKQNFRLWPPPNGKLETEKLKMEAALAASMLELAASRYRAKHFMKAADGPFYLRKSDAEERLS